MITSNNKPSFHKNKEYFSKREWTIDKVQEEIKQGLALLNSIDKPIVTFFGSHKIKPTNAYYKHCEEVAFELGKKGYAVMTGGGPGIMHAANSGATRVDINNLLENFKTNIVSSMSFQFYVLQEKLK